MTSTNEPYALLAETARQRDEARRQVAALEAELVGVRSQLAAVRRLADELAQAAAADWSDGKSQAGAVLDRLVAERLRAALGEG